MVDTPGPDPRQQDSLDRWRGSDPVEARRGKLSPEIVRSRWRADRLSPHHGKHPNLSEQARSAESQTYTYETNASVSSFALSPDKSRLILAGRNVFQILCVDQVPFTTEDDIRAALRTFGKSPTSSGTKGSTTLWETLGIKDVQWMHSSLDKKIVTAAANGQVVLYDVEKEGYEWCRLHQHTRQVHRLSVNPIESGLLLSASQDSTVRLWDLRIGAISNEAEGEKRNSICFYGNNGPVRDVRWSPKHFHEYASATDGGIVQKWDIRKSNAPVLRVAAHGKPCNSIDWHPNGEVLLSAGADKDIKVWDLSSSGRRNKTLFSFRAPQAVINARWRLLDAELGTNTQDVLKDLQIATSFDQSDPRILLWKCASPETPNQIIYLDEGPANCLLWQSPSILLSADGHGRLLKTDITRLPRKESSITRGLAAFRPDGEITQLLNRRRAKDSAIQGDDILLSEDRQLVDATETGPADELDFSMPIALAPYTQVANLKLDGLTVNIDVLKFTSANYVEMPGVPDSVKSNEVHLDIERAMLQNADVANKAFQPNRSRHWRYLALIGRASLESRATTNRQSRGNSSDEAPFQPSDFRPNEHDDKIGCLPSMPALIGRLIEENDHSIGHLQMVAYILINLIPWFPLRDHACSQQAVRDNVIQSYHDWLYRLGLFTAACALRKSWARVSPNVPSYCAAANASNAKLFCIVCQKVVKGPDQSKCDRCKSLVFVCAYCHLQKPQGLWFWCQRCGHGGHLTCMKQWFLNGRADPSLCPTVACGCECAPGADGDAL